MDGIGILLLALSALTATVTALRAARRRIGHLDEVVRSVEAQRSSLAQLQRSVESYEHSTDRALEEIARYVSDDALPDELDPSPPQASNASQELIESRVHQWHVNAGDVLNVLERQNTYEVVREFVRASHYKCGWRGVSVAPVAVLISELAATVPKWSGDARARAIRKLSEEISHVGFEDHSSLTNMFADPGHEFEAEGRDTKPVIWAFVRVSSSSSVPMSPDVRPSLPRPSISGESRAVGRAWSDWIAFAKSESSGSWSSSSSRERSQPDDDSEAVCASPGAR